MAGRVLHSIDVVQYGFKRHVQMVSLNVYGTKGWVTCETELAGLGGRDLPHLLLIKGR